jgi:hypothetical protein
MAFLFLFVVLCLLLRSKVGALSSVPPHDLVGSFRLSIGTDRSVPIAPFASSSELTSALAALPSMESPITVLSSHGNDYMEWLVTFSDSSGNDFDLDIDLDDLASTNPDDNISYSVTTSQVGALSDSYGAAYLYSDATTCGSIHLVDEEPPLPATVVDETRCSGGIPRTFAIIAEAESALGGSFDVYYEGNFATVDLSATTTDVETTIRSLSSALNTTTVEERSYQGSSAYGRVWIVRHPAMVERTEELVISDKWTMGSNARVGIYPVLSIQTSADANDIVGNYRIHLDGESTAPMAMDAAADDIMAELHELVGIGKVVSVSPPTPTGATQAQSPSPGSPIDYSFAVMAHTADLDSFFVAPEANWGGTEARIFAIGPNGQAPMHYVVPTDADEGIHSVRISAHNGQGYSAPSPLVTVMPGTMLPGAPQGVRLGDYYRANELSLSYQPPAHDGGSSITKYKVEWSTSVNFENASFDEITVQPEEQEIVLSCRTKCHGSFTLSWAGKISDPIATDATASELEAQIAALITNSEHDGSSDISVRVSRRGQGFGYRWLVTFANAPGNLGELVADGHWLYGGNAHVWVEKGSISGDGSADIYPGAFTNEVQTVYVSKLPGFATPATGTFQLLFEDKTTDTIDVSASADDVKAALEGLGTIHTVNVESQTFGGQPGWTITFTHLIDEGGKGAGDIDMLRVVDAQLSESTVTSIEVFENVKGTEPFRYRIDGLTEGHNYYARVFAQNQVGWSKPSIVASAVPKSQPGIPAMVNVSISPDSRGTSLDVSWLPPPTLGGDDELLGYEVEYYSTPPVREVQKVTTSSTRGVADIQTIRSAADSNSIGGFFTLSFKGERTEPIAYNSLADGKNSIESKLKRLSTIGHVAVTRDISTRPVQNEAFVLTNGSASIGRGAGSAADLTSLFAAGEVVIVGSEQHTVASVNPTSLTLEQTYEGPSASEAHVSKWAYGYEWQVVFESHIGEQPLLHVEPAENWAGDNPTLTVRHTRRGLAPMSGTFQLSHGGEKTEPLAWNVDEYKVQAALESLHGIGKVEVTRYSNAQGFNWLVTFLDVNGDGGGGDIPLMGITDRMLNGPNAKARVASIVDGVQGNDHGRIEALASEKSVTLQDLSKGTPLFISVRAKNTQGYGASRRASPSPIAPKTAPNVPLNVEAVPLSGSKILVRWEDPDDDGGSEIGKYRVEWDLSNAYDNVASPGFHTFVKGNDKHEYIVSIDEDSASIPRHVRVSCHNGYGWSSPVEALGSPVRAALQLPAKPEFEATVTSGTGAMLTWSKATWDTVVSYVVEVYEV